MGRWLRDDRGQVLVVGALLIAVLFVGLALVLNSAIYAENIGSRGDTSTAGAVSNDAITEDRLEEMLATENYAIEDDEYSDRRARIRANLTQWDRIVGANQAVEGELFLAEPTAMTNGTRVAQDEYGNFMPAKETFLDNVTTSVFDWLSDDFRVDLLGLGNKKNWMVANDTDVRDFQMTVTRDSLYDKHTGLLDDLVTLFDGIVTGSTVFWTEFDHEDSDERWRMYLLDDEVNESVEAVVVEYDDGDPGADGTVRGRCSAPGEQVTVRVGSGELVGDDGVVQCPAIGDALDSDSLDVHYAGADEVNGTYRFLVNDSESDYRERLTNQYGTYLENALDTVVNFLTELFGSENLTEDVLFEDNSSDGNPYTTTAIYDVTVETTYRDDRVSLTRNVTYPAAG